MNWLDKSISWLSPSAGARRLRARLAAEMLSRYYEGASTGRRTDGWVTTAASANSEISLALPKLRARSRDLVRNNPWASKALHTWAANLVGTGIIPKVKDKAQNDLFVKWAKECDADGQLDFYGLQELMARCMAQDGEVLVRLRPRLPTDGLSVPLQLQVLEADYIDTARVTPSNPNNTIYHGIEIDPIGKRAGYWLWQIHPGDWGQSNQIQPMQSRFVPADYVLHVYHKTRPGQMRGVPWNASAMIKMRDDDEYDEATLVRKKVEACIVGFVEQPDSAGLPLGDVKTDPNTGERVESFSPGQWVYGKPGEKVNFNTAAAPTGHAEYSKSNKHAIAAGWGITYEDMTGDLSMVNFSSMRGGQNNFRRYCEMIQWLTLIPMGLAPIYRAWADAAQLAGKLKRPEREAAWTAPKWPYVNPVQDIQATKDQIRGGLMTVTEALKLQGYDPEEVFAERLAEMERFKKDGLYFDTDPLVLGMEKGKVAPPPDEAGGAGNDTGATTKLAVAK